MTDFVTFARAHGVVIEDLHASERIRRCATEKNPRKKNGAYFWDGSRGFVFAWDGDARAHWYSDPNAKPWTPAEQAAWQADRRAMDNEHRLGQERAAVRAQELMRGCVPGEHNYLAFKGFPKARGMVTPDGELLVPMRSAVSNQVQGAQLIRWLDDERRYDKKMLRGMKAKGAVLRLGRADPETVLVEGYATGLSVQAAARSVGLTLTVLVCFSDGNFRHVAPLVRGHAFIYADNDKSGAGERAAQETGLPYCMSDIEGNDANDDHQQLGLIAICTKLMEVRRQPVPTG